MVELLVFHQLPSLLPLGPVLSAPLIADLDVSPNTSYEFHFHASLMLMSSLLGHKLEVSGPFLCKVVFILCDVVICW